MTTLALAAALLNMGHPSATPADLSRARLLAATIASAGRAHGIDPLILAAVAAHETRFDRTQIGALGERGRWQVLPKTARALGYQGGAEALANDPINADVAAAYLAHVRAICAKHGHRKPADWLNAYRGAGCRTSSGRPSRYARQILDLAGMARALAEAPPPPALAAYQERIEATTRRPAPR